MLQPKWVVLGIIPSHAELLGAAETPGSGVWMAGVTGEQLQPK